MKRWSSTEMDNPGMINFVPLTQGDNEYNQAETDIAELRLPHIQKEIQKRGQKRQISVKRMNHLARFVKRGKWDTPLDRLEYSPEEFLLRYDPYIAANRIYTK